MTNHEATQILMDHFGMCGCSEEDVMILPITRVLAWAISPIDARPKYDELFKEPALFYIIAGILNDLEYLEHGSSIRHAWASKTAYEFMDALKNYKHE